MKSILVILALTLSTMGCSDSNHLSILAGGEEKDFKISEVTVKYNPPSSGGCALVGASQTVTVKGEVDTKESKIVMTFLPDWSDWLEMTTYPQNLYGNHSEKKYKVQSFNNDKMVAISFDELELWDGEGKTKAKISGLIEFELEVLSIDPIAMNALGCI